MPTSELRKLERYATIADAIAVVETFAEQIQKRRVRVQQPKPSNKQTSLGFSEADSTTPTESIVDSSTSDAVLLECENAPACKWFVRLSFVKGEKKWKISSMNTVHHKTKCSESRRSNTSSMATDQLLASANASAAAALADTTVDEAAAAMDAPVDIGTVFSSWKEALAAIRSLALQMGRRVMAEKAEPMTWCGKPVMARRIVCQNNRNSNCDWMVMLDEATDESERYTVLSMDLLHSKECLETCNFTGKRNEATPPTTRGDPITDALGLTGSALPGSFSWVN